MPVLWILLWPLVALAQVTIEPLRLDDSLASYYYYPFIEREPDGSLLCAWGCSADSLFAAAGRRVALDGTLLGEPVLFDEVAGGTLSCPPHLKRVHTAAGQTADLFVRG